MSTFTGNCYCGAVEVEVQGKAIVEAICHCQICRDWSASPVNGAALWKPEDVKITKGKEHIKSNAAVVGHDKTWCTICGGHLLTDHSASFGVIDVYACILNDYGFTPSFHINYESTVMPMPDGLPKYKDFPASMGGSDERMDE